MLRAHLTSLAMVIATAVWSVGCGTSTPPAPKANGGHGHEGHDHNHAHHGPHGGHIIEIGDEEYHGEWTHEEDGKIDVYLLDSEMKKSVSIPAEKIEIEVKIGDAEPKSFDLVAVNRTEGENPVTSQFQITDKNLLGVLETLGKGVEATLKVTIKDKPFVAKIAKDEDGHGHKH